MYENVLNTIGSDLAICTGDKWLDNQSFLEVSNYHWIIDEPEDWKHYYEEHFDGTWNDYFLKGKDKKLVYVSSKVGSIGDNSGGGSYIYRSSKTALNQVVKSLSIDLKDQGFEVVAVHPGWVQTDMGGPNALIDVTTSVAGLINVITNLSGSDSGKFFNYDGQTIPW